MSAGETLTRTQSLAASWSWATLLRCRRILKEIAMPAAHANMHRNAIVLVTTSSAMLVIASTPIVSLNMRDQQDRE